MVLGKQLMFQHELELLKVNEISCSMMNYDYITFLHVFRMATPMDMIQQKILRLPTVL